MTTYKIGANTEAVMNKMQEALRSTVRTTAMDTTAAGLGSVEIQDSRGSLFVIQASDGTIRFD